MGNILTCFASDKNSSLKDQIEKLDLNSSSLYIIQETIIEKYNIQTLYGDIYKQESDALVIIQDSYMSFQGQLGQKLKKKGGKCLIDECNRILTKNGFLKEYNIYYTHGGGLNFEYLFHINIPQLKKLNGCQKASLFDLIQNILRKAFDLLDLKSISIPMLAQPDKKCQCRSDDIQSLYSMTICIMFESIKKYIENQNENNFFVVQVDKNGNKQDFNTKDIFDDSDNQRQSSDQEYDKKALKSQKMQGSYIQRPKSNEYKQIFLITDQNSCCDIFKEEFQDVFIHQAPVNLRKSLLRSTFASKTDEQIYKQKYKQQKEYEQYIVDKNQDKKLNNSKKEQQKYLNKQYYQNHKISEEYYDIKEKDSNIITESEDNPYQSSMNISDIFEMTPHAIHLKSKMYQNKGQSGYSEQNEIYQERKPSF